MRIGFFGDSFCAVEKVEPQEYETYIHKLKKHYNAKLVNLGIAGSSIYDAIMLQFKPFYVNKTVPDVCVFTWTNYSRLFNREIRNLNPRTDTGIYKYYIKHIYDEEQSILQYISTLTYFDIQILSTLPNTKFIHTFCFGSKLITFDTARQHIFNNGVTINSSLYSLARCEPDQYLMCTKNIDKPNHIIGDKKNLFLYETIMNAIDNYENRKVVTTNYEDTQC
jgi:hypothetical protein